MSTENMLADPEVAEALRAAFGGQPIETSEAMGGGLSGAQLCKVTVVGKSYVVRRTFPNGPINDPVRELGCMRIAAERGIAPAIAYVDVERGISIAEHIDSVQLGAWLQGGGDGAKAIAKLAALLRTLHGSPLFPPIRATTPGRTESAVTVASACRGVAKILAQGNGGELTPFATEVLPFIDRMQETLAPHVTLRSCHYDLNPGNILVGAADDRFWLVDWEIACAGDPFHDLATLAVFLFKSREAEAYLLASYLGRAPTAIDLARFELSQARALSLYSLMFGTVALARGLPFDVPADASSPLQNPGGFGASLAALAREAFARPTYREAVTTLAS